MYHRPSALLAIYYRPPEVLEDDVGGLISFETLPLSVTLKKADHRSADTCKVTFNIEDFPLEARLIRGITFEVYFADLSGATASRDAMAYWAGLSRDQRRTHCVFAGVADSVENVIGDGGRRITLAARDYSAYFLDARLNAEIRWGTKSFVQHIADLIRMRETTEALGIEIAVASESGALVRTILDPAQPIAPQLAAAPALVQAVGKIRPKDYKARGDDADPDLSKRMPRDGETIWEAIKEVALEAGFIVYVELDRVVIASPKVLNPAAVPPPGERFRMTLGHNILEYTAERELGRQTNINVQVTSFDPVAGRTLVAMSPKTPAAETDNPGAGGALGDAQSKTGTAKKQVTVTPIAVRGIRLQSQLQAIADGIVEQMKHHDNEVRLTTHSMVDTDLRPLWEARHADPFVIDISVTYNGVLAFSVQEQVQRLVRLGFSASDANALIGPNDELGGFLGQLSLPLALAEIEFQYAQSEWSVSITLRGRRQVTIEADGTAPVAGG